MWRMLAQAAFMLRQCAALGSFDGQSLYSFGNPPSVAFAKLTGRINALVAKMAAAGNVVTTLDGPDAWHAAVLRIFREYHAAFLAEADSDEEEDDDGNASKRAAKPAAAAAAAPATAAAPAAPAASAVGAPWAAWVASLAPRLRPADEAACLALAPPAPAPVVQALQTFVAGWRTDADPAPALTTLAAALGVAPVYAAVLSLSVGGVDVAAPWHNVVLNVLALLPGTPHAGAWLPRRAALAVAGATAGHGPTTLLPFPALVALAQATLPAAAHATGPQDTAAAATAAAAAFNPLQCALPCDAVVAAIAAGRFPRAERLARLDAWRHAPAWQAGIEPAAAPKQPSAAAPPVAATPATAAPTAPSRQLTRQASVTVHDDFLCPVSFELMLEPTTLECGHTFERENLEGLPACPMCRRVFTGLPPVSILVRNTIERLCASIRIWGLGPQDIFFNPRLVGYVLPQVPRGGAPGPKCPPATDTDRDHGSACHRGSPPPI